PASWRVPSSKSLPSRPHSQAEVHPWECRQIQQPIQPADRFDTLACLRPLHTIDRVHQTRERSDIQCHKTCVRPADWRIVHDRKMRTEMPSSAHRAMSSTKLCLAAMNERSVGLKRSHKHDSYPTLSPDLSRLFAANSGTIS